MLHTNRHRIGLRRRGSVLLLDMYSGGRQKPPDTSPLRYPFPGQYGVPPVYDSSEWPDPTGGRGSAGYPIGVRVGGDSVSAATASLVGGRKRGPLPCSVTWPGNPANEAFPDNQGQILVLPRRPLASFSRYEVIVRYPEYGEAKELSRRFFTGRMKH